MLPGVYKSLLGKILWSHGHRSLNGADGTDLSVDKTTLTFTTTTWETAQTVTVTAVEDELSEGDESFTVTHTVTSAADSNYDGTAAGSVAVTVKDAPGGAISETALIVQEGNTGTYTVVLNTEPAGDVTVTISGHAGPDVSVDKTTLTFTATTWETAQTVTVTAVDDEIDDGETVTLTHTVASAADSDYEGISAGSVAVSITDDDLPSVNVSFEQSTYTVQEGNSTTVKVKLNQSQGEMHIRRIPSNRGRTDFNVRAVELYLAAPTRTHHLRNVDLTLALV